MSLKSLSLYLFQEEEVAPAVGEGEQTDATASVTAGDEVGQVVETGDAGVTETGETTDVVTSVDTSLDTEASAELTEAEVEIPETDESVTEEVVEVAQDEATDAEEVADADVEALDMAADAGDEAEEAAASVEHFITVLQHGLNTKTYSPQFAATCHFEMAKMSKVLGLEKGTPSLESYDKQTLEGYYTASLESFRGFLKRLTDVTTRINDFIPDLIGKGQLVNGFKKRAAAINSEADSLGAALGSAGNGSATVKVGKDLATGGDNLVNGITADLRLTTAVATKGLGANQAFIKAVADVLVEATNEGGVGKTGQIVAKAAKITPAVNAYPAEAFTQLFAGGRKLVKAEGGEGGDTRGTLKAFSKSAIPSVGSGSVEKVGEVTLTKADLGKLVGLAKAYAALANKAADSTGVAALGELKTVRNKTDRANGANSLITGRNAGAEATSWSEGKDLDALATNLPKYLQNHIAVYRFVNGHALSVAQSLLALVKQASGRLKDAA